MFISLCFLAYFVVGKNRNRFPCQCMFLMRDCFCLGFCWQNNRLWLVVQCRYSWPRARIPAALSHWGMIAIFSLSLSLSFALPTSIQHKHNLLHPSFPSTPPCLSFTRKHTHTHTHTHRERESAVRTHARVGSLHFPGSSSQYRRSRTWTLDLCCPPRFCSCWKFNDVLHY